MGRQDLGLGREELPTARFSTATLCHSSVAARVAAQLERAGVRVFSKREIEARERDERTRTLSAQWRSGRYQCPDLVVLGDPPVAVESRADRQVDPASRRDPGGLEALARSPPVRPRPLSLQGAGAALRRARRQAHRQRVDVDLEPSQRRDGHVVLGRPLQPWTKALLFTFQ